MLQYFLFPSKQETCHPVHAFYEHRDILNQRGASYSMRTFHHPIGFISATLPLASLFQQKGRC